MQSRPSLPMDDDYPNVICEKPGHPAEPGYVVCWHVLRAGAPVADVEPASRDQIGVIACAECSATHSLDPDRTECVCVHCAAERGWLKRELN